MSARVIVRVPATTANLGPGFDSLGMALDLWNHFELTLEESEAHELSEPVRLVEVNLEGEGAGILPKDSTNLVYRAFRMGFEGVNLPSGRVRLRIVNRVPLSSGLGSSATAIVGGLLAANALRERPLPRSRLVEIAAGIEGHPDNVAPALMGGLVVSVMHRSGEVTALSITVPDDLWVCVAVPDFYLDTRFSRGRLPERVTREDAVYNLSRAALWVAAIAQGELEALKVATEDVLHQPYRSELIPGLKDVFDAALSAGAFGVALSGSGPSVAAFCRRADAEAISDAMSRSFSKVGVTTRSVIARPAAQGAQVAVEGSLAGRALGLQFERNISGGV